MFFYVVSYFHYPAPMSYKRLQTSLPVSTVRVHAWPQAENRALSQKWIADHILI